VGFFILLAKIAKVMKMKEMKVLLLALVYIFFNNAIVASEWQKQTIMEKGRNTTAVAADYTGDGQVDVITSYPGKVSLFVAPHWAEIILYGLDKPKQICIHSETLDIDGDGDMDWVGSSASGMPFWLENPGSEYASTKPWVSRVIDHEITGIHCLLKADVDNDGRLDIIINNFKPEGDLGGSIFWLEIPQDVKQAKAWKRHAFAYHDAHGGSHYFGFGDIDGDDLGEIAVAAKGGVFEGGDWFAYWSRATAKELVKAPWKKTIIAEQQIGATNIQIGDVNADGLADFVASRGHGVGVVWFESPNWIERSIDADMESPHSLVLADLDLDGDLDVASCGFKSERLSVYMNNGLGKFTQLDLDTAQQSYDLRAVDMDGDGDLDLLNAGRGTGNVVWYENPRQPT